MAERSSDPAEVDTAPAAGVAAGEAAEADAARKEKVARAVAALGAAGVGYWLGQELADEPAKLDEGQELVYYVGGQGSPPDLWLGATDVQPGDSVRLVGPVAQARYLKAANWQKLGLEQPVRSAFTRVLVRVGQQVLPLFFAGDVRDRFKEGEPAAVYTQVLGLDRYGKPSERLDLGQRGGGHLLTADDNLQPPFNWEPVALAAGLGLAVWRGRESKIGTTETERR